MNSNPDDKLYEELKALYPHLSHEELIEAGQNLDTYIDHTIGQFERIRQDPERYKTFLVLTELKGSRYDESDDTLPSSPSQSPTCLENS
jgi:hypothetical protein